MNGNGRTTTIRGRRAEGGWREKEIKRSGDGMTEFSRCSVQVLHHFFRGRRVIAVQAQAITTESPPLLYLSPLSSVSLSPLSHSHLCIYIYINLCHSIFLSRSHFISLSHSHSLYNLISLSRSLSYSTHVFLTHFQLNSDILYRYQF